MSARMLARLSGARGKALLKTVTSDLDTTDVEVYGCRKQEVAYTYQRQRCGRRHVATWAQADVALAAELLAGNEDPRRGAPGLPRRALAALSEAGGQVTPRADGRYFAVDLAVAAYREGVGFAIGAKRIAPPWRILTGVGETDWVEAIDMPGARVAVADYRPA